MPLRLLTTVLGICMLAVVANAAPAEDPETIAADEKMLREAGLGSDGPTLLEFFRKRTLPEVQREKIQDLIKQLGDDSFVVRQKASNELLVIGPTASSLLRQVAADKEQDIEVIRRAERCLVQIEKNYSPAIAAAAARTLARRKSEGTVEVLLAYLPFAEEEFVVEEIRATLTAVAFTNGQPDKALVNALEDKDVRRRGIAADALVRGGNDAQRNDLRKMYKDAEPSIRMRVALAMVEMKDKEAVPVLINLLAEAPREQCWKAEDILFRLAGEQAPPVSLGTDDASRKKCRDAWSAWWTKSGADVKLAKLDEVPKMLGQTLILEMTQGVQGRVREVGRDGKTIWQIDNIQYGVDAQMIGKDRVLIAEYTQRRVSERDLKGNIVWQKQIGGAAVTSYPLCAQRLANGNTFIVTRNQLMEVDKEGKETVIYNRAGQDIISGLRTRDGNMVVVTRTGQCIRLDAAGKEMKTFAVGQVTSLGTHIDVLPNGRIIIPLTNQNKVVEYDPDGRQVWEANATQPTSVKRLPNGNTLIASMSSQQIVEIDRSGKEVSQTRSEGRLMQVSQR